jgi:hypothetical protein
MAAEPEIVVELLDFIGGCAKDQMQGRTGR